MLCSGTSERQINTLADQLEDAMYDKGLEVRAIEGKNASGWILMDFGDMIVNLFTGGNERKIQHREGSGETANSSKWRNKPIK